MKKPNGILMGEAIFAEERAAHKERRPPSSSNVLRLFAKSSRNRLTYAESVRLFDYVFSEYQKVTGVEAISLPPPGLN
jgi:hypothetical protein